MLFVQQVKNKHLHRHFRAEQMEICVVQWIWLTDELFTVFVHGIEDEKCFVSLVRYPQFNPYDSIDNIMFTWMAVWV